MRFLITGAGGQLGSELVRILADEKVYAFGSAELDITDLLYVGRVVRDIRPDVIINAAAYTAVDLAESEEDKAYQVNATGPANLAIAAGEVGARLIHVSTDYVFAGDASRPYEVTDPTGPKSAYGRTKLAGEQAVRELLPESGYVVRTTWLYGATGKNFVRTIVRLSGEQQTLTVVADQRGTPTWSADLAAGLVELAGSAAPAGTYHLTGAGETTWHGFAQAIFEELGADPGRVQPITTDQYPTPAARPAYAVLSDAAWRAAGLTPPRPWREVLATAFTEHRDAFRS